jgi:hypothetical protein
METELTVAIDLPHGVFHFVRSALLSILIQVLWFLREKPVSHPQLALCFTASARVSTHENSSTPPTL